MSNKPQAIYINKKGQVVYAPGADKLTKLNRERNIKRLADRKLSPLQKAMEVIESMGKK